MTAAGKPWTAIESTDPTGANRRITVTGEVDAIPNQTPALSEAVPQGSNPTILLLDLTMTAGGPGGRDVKFAKPCSAGQYKQAQIRGAPGGDVTIDVQVVLSD